MQQEIPSENRYVTAHLSREHLLPTTYAAFDPKTAPGRRTCNSYEEWCRFDEAVTEVPGLDLYHEEWIEHGSKTKTAGESK